MIVLAMLTFFAAVILFLVFELIHVMGVEVRRGKVSCLSDKQALFPLQRIVLGEAIAV